MPTAADAIIKMEAGQTLVAFTALTDSGDHQTFTSADEIWSGADGKTPIVRPNGIVTGANVVTVPSSGSADVVDVAAFTAYSAGTLFSVAADADFALTTPSGAYAKINSITMTSTGGLAIVAGTTATNTTFSTTRAASGGPPLIPVDSVEVAQVQMVATTAVITADQIFQVVGTHTERADYPAWNEDNTGRGNVLTTVPTAEVNAHVKFDSALPLSHTGPTARKVYNKYYVPTLVQQGRPNEYKAAEETTSVSSEQYYGGTVANSSKSLGAGSFTLLLTDGVTDGIVAANGDTRTIQFFPNKNKSPYQLMQGALGVSREFPVAGSIKATVTVAAPLAASDFSS